MCSDPNCPCKNIDRALEAAQLTLNSMGRLLSKDLPCTTLFLVSGPNSWRAFWILGEPSVEVDPRSILGSADHENPLIAVRALAVHVTGIMAPFVHGEGPVQ